MKRSELVEAMIERTLDDCDMDVLFALASDQLRSNFKNYTLLQLKNEANEFWPDLLETQ